MVEQRLLATRVHRHVHPRLAPTMKLFLFTHALGALALVSALSPRARAQDGVAEPNVRASAHRRTLPITVDGRIDEQAWTDCPPVRGFVQRFPDAGKAPSQDTDFRIEFDDEAIYVAVRAHDNHPDLIRGLLTRRDKDSSSDWIMIGIDSYHDRRTGFAFGINPAGVQRDLLIYDDQQMDESWDAVWTAQTSIDADGWSAEFRIPLSQLRFSSDDAASWGFQVQRVVQRTSEESVWSPWPKSSSRVVSKFGTLEGVSGLQPARRLELLPYVSGGGALEESIDHADPFARSARGIGNVGADVRLGLGSAFTLAATINPDFGQVEADPSQVNLSANELFFPEKRPFFLEGIDIFQFSTSQGDGPSVSDSLFYTRRIGARPHGDTDDYAYVDAPQSTTIYGAAKVSGKTSSGWSLGVLDAITSEETARVADDAGMRTTPIVEPLSNYAVARVKKDLREGRTTLGGAITAVNRELAGTGLETTMHDQAYSGGLQLQHRFGPDDLLESNVRVFGSWIHGTPDAILDTQQKIRHLFQRPDQDYLHLDPRATSMAGTGFLIELGRFQGPGWHYGTGIDSKSPGFESNDAGFQQLADYYLQWGSVEYRDDQPSGNLLMWSASVNAWTFTNYDPQVIEVGGNMSAHAMFDNHWDVQGGMNIADHRWDPAALRGGPELRLDPGYNLYGNVTSDTRKAVWANLSVQGGYRPAASNTWRLDTSAGVTVQARSNLDLFLGPGVQLVGDDAQYVDQVDDAAGATHYVFGRLHEVVTSLTLRANWTFSPHVSLQVYAMPFVATGRYSNLKESADTHAAHYEDRFRVFGNDHLMPGTDTVMADADGNGSYDFTFAKPDFTVRQLRSNAVLRWEYRPGSALFLIWSHDGEGSDVGDGRYRFATDLSQLARQPGEDIVMAKLNYWVGL
jgi:Domain of unknown function (DUF5916)